MKSPRQSKFSFADDPSPVPPWSESSVRALKEYLGMSVRQIARRARVCIATMYGKSMRAGGPFAPRLQVKLDAFAATIPALRAAFLQQKREQQEAEALVKLRRSYDYTKIRFLAEELDLTSVEIATLFDASMDTVNSWLTLRRRICKDRHIDLLREIMEAYEGDSRPAPPPKWRKTETSSLPRVRGVFHKLQPGTYRTVGMMILPDASFRPSRNQNWEIRSLSRGRFFLRARYPISFNLVAKPVEIRRGGAAQTGYHLVSASQSAGDRGASAKTATAEGAHRKRCASDNRSHSEFVVGSLLARDNLASLVLYVRGHACMRLILAQW